MSTITDAATRIKARLNTLAFQSVTVNHSARGVNVRCTRPDGETRDFDILRHELDYSPNQFVDALVDGARDFLDL